MVADRVLLSGALLAIASACTGCNKEPARCPVLDDRYVLSYRSLAAECNIGPYEIDVVGDGTVRTTTEMRPDAVIKTDVHLRGCTLSLGVEVVKASSEARMSVANGNLTVYSADSISGVGMATKFGDDGSLACDGRFELSLKRVPMATAGSFQF